MSDTHFIRIVGSANIAEPPQERTDYLIAMEAYTDGKNERDNHDGSKTITHLCKLLGNVRLERQGAHPIFGKARKGSPSQKLRASLYRLFEWKGEGDFEEWYAKRIELFIDQVKKELSEV